MISPVVNTILGIMLIFLTLMTIPCVWRVIIGPAPADRLQGIDTLTSLMIGIVVLLGLTRNIPMLFSVGIALAAFSFIGTIALARYLGSGRMF
ncbi:MAG: hypothetical protein KJ043_18570 [Anaerolineae bacterium]|nr:hypothetical protein [Anaerolineae bacterium]